ncbi:CapA family protein [Microbulbifer echini]|uniref:CapA family protein n=1 Tax=Microbulbifer echini TaxID=1529067 RepID=A0ABV4NK56_9GAMM
MSLSSMLKRARPLVERALSTICPPYTLFFSISDAKQRATVRHTNSADFPKAWQALSVSAYEAAQRSKIEPCWLRVDWVTSKSATTLAGFHEILANTKRGYFRYGLALDLDCKIAFLEQELNGNAMLDGGNRIDHAILNEKNFTSYSQIRFGPQVKLDFPEDKNIVILSTEGIFCENAQDPIHLYPSGLDAGRRAIKESDSTQITRLILSSSRYLAKQVKSNGRFQYGWHSCFDREIETYNNLHHASSTYSMIEAWEVSKDPDLLKAIQQTLKYLAKKSIKIATLESGETAAFLVESSNEIKLGSNAMSLLALVKYSEVVQSRTYTELTEQLGRGIEYMQNPDSGQFCHVLEYPSLNKKVQRRILCHDGEAAFALIRLYGWNKNPRWLAIVETAFEYFIVSEHWRAHDYWLSHSVNELTIYRPEEKYYQFGIRNFANHLNFVERNIVTFPTLLQLMMAAEKLISKIHSQGKFQYLLDQIDLEHFYRALHKRANYLFNGYFWPEFAMFFKNPAKILGSFFIRHLAFRIRIDDVEHYLSGLIAYREYLVTNKAKGQQIALKLPYHVVEDPGNKTVTSKDLQIKSVLAWGGGVNLGRRQHYRTAQLGIKKVLGEIPALNNADLSVVNLECVVATEGEQGIPKGEVSPSYYRARPEMLSVLFNAGVDIVTTANNHCGDYGATALLEQEFWLNTTGIGYTGSGETFEEALTPIIRPAGNINVAIFSLDASQPRFAAGPTNAGCAYLPLSIPDLWIDTLKPRIAAARKKAHVILVAVHWEANRELYPSSKQIAVAHRIIEAGADGVLGSSTHNLQGIEIYRERPIIHDAGDLLFDAVRNSLADSGIFRLQLSTSGIEQITFVPVGVGFGFSRQLSGRAAGELSEKFSNICLSLGTRLHLHRDGSATLRLTPPERTTEKLPTLSPTTHQQDRILAKRPPKPQWQVASVPADARIAPLKIGPLVLLGVRFYPRELKSRQTLWVESFWSAENKVHEDFRLDFQAIPDIPTSMPTWGRFMDHDPCDWQLPTSEWNPGIIYRDLYGLRAPASQDLIETDLQLHIGLISNQTQIKPIPVIGMITRQDFSTYKKRQNRRIPEYRTVFPSSIYHHPPGQTWNAAQLTDITGGTWLVPPPNNWFVRSVISDSRFIEQLSGPILFAAHTNLDRSHHERSENVSAKFWDSHKEVPTFAHQLAGAIVSRPVEGLPKNLPVLKVDDPIKAIMELGFAARERFDGEVIAITGTAGKSATLKMIGEMLDPREKVLTSPKNYNSRVNATSILANLNKDHEIAIIEIAQSALRIKSNPITHRIKPTISLITDIDISQTSQMEKSIEDTAKCKSRIYNGLSGSAIAIVGEHLHCFDYVLKEAKKYARRVIRFGESPQAEIRITKIHTDEFGSQVSLKLSNRKIMIRIPAPSISMLHNAVSAIAVVYALNGNIDEAARRLGEISLNQATYNT